MIFMIYDIENSYSKKYSDNIGMVISDSTK